MAGDKRKSGKYSTAFFVLLALLLAAYLIKTNFFSDTEKNIKKEGTGLNQDTVTEPGKQPGKINERNIPVDTTPQIILLCGDSMADGLFEPFKDFSNYNGHLLTFSNWGSSTTTAWVYTEKMKKMIEKYQPTYIILELGSNELLTTRLKELEDNVRTILKQSGNIKLIWVGPPNWKADNGFNDVLKKTLGEGKYFLSKNLLIERGEDGIHPTIEGYYKWAAKISEWIEHQSDYPVRITIPSENTQGK